MPSDTAHSSAVAEPSGAANTEHKRSFNDVVKAHNWDDMKNVARTEPCAREGFLYGIGTGFGVAVLRFFQRGKIFSAGNWGVATFAAVAILSKQLCHFQHAHQRAKIHTLMEMQTKTVQHKIEGFEAAEESKSE